MLETPKKIDKNVQIVFFINNYPFSHGPGGRGHLGIFPPPKSIPSGQFLNKYHLKNILQPVSDFFKTLPRFVQFLPDYEMK